MRILFTGLSGVRHDEVRSNLLDYILEKTTYRKRDIISKDIGNILTNDEGIDWFNFLEAEDTDWQNRKCRSATEKAVDEINDREPEVAMLSTHLCMFRNSRIFTPIDWELIGQFSPDYTITLIDDIYTIQSRINNREKSGSTTESYLRLRELLTWRSVEILMTDRLVKYLRSHSHDVIDNYLVAVKHPSSMLYKLIFSSNPIVYAGSSISEPRKSEEGIEEVNRFRKKLHTSFPSFDPTTIDEGILKWKFFDENNILKDEYKDKEHVELCKEDRWPLHFEGYRPLCDDENEFPIKLRIEEIEEVALPVSDNSKSDIYNQIRTRDYRLIDQSDFLAGYRPYYLGKSSTGLTSELNYVKSNAHIPPIVVHKEEDGNWGGHPFSNPAIRTDSIDELVTEIENRGR